MPRGTQGDYSLPAGTLVNSGDVIMVSQHNPAMLDIANALSNSLDRNGTGGMRANLSMNGFRITGLAQGSSPGDAVTVEQASGLGVPIGGVIDFAGENPPSGYLLCYGQAVSRTEYPDLFSAIGVLYGIGDGATTFNVPDCRGVVSAGRGDMGGTLSTRLSNFASTVLGSIFGSQSHTLTTDQMPAHNHTGTTASAGAHTHTLLVGEGYDGPSTYMDLGGQNSYGYQSGRMGSAGAHTHTFTTANRGGGEAHNNTQPTIIFNKIIKARV